MQESVRDKIYQLKGHFKAIKRDCDAYNNQQNKESANARQMRDNIRSIGEFILNDLKELKNQYPKLQLFGEFSDDITTYQTCINSISHTGINKMSFPSLTGIIQHKSVFDGGRLPWHFGRTVGGRYGQTKRLLQAIAKGKDDPRWLKLVGIALSGRKVPAEYALAVAPFEGTADQRQMLKTMLADVKAGLKKK